LGFKNYRKYCADLKNANIPKSQNLPPPPKKKRIENKKLKNGTGEIFTYARAIIQNY
jgi:hypothetical protein